MKTSFELPSLFTLDGRHVTPDDDPTLLSENACSSGSGDKNGCNSGAGKAEAGGNGCSGGGQ